MKLLQLKYLMEINRHGNHISNTADALHTSQPGISRQVQLLEEELGFAVFARKRNRIIGLTEPGREAMAIVRRVMSDIDNLQRLGEEVSARDVGSLTIATTHTQARYVLPAVVERFTQRHPKVRLHLRQGNPTQIREMVEAGESDLAIGTEATRPFDDLVRLDCFELERIIVVKSGHPLLKIRKPTLLDVAGYPLITYDPNYSGRWKVMDAFAKVGITPNVVFGVMDADVSKTYVELGLGIAVMTAVSYNKARDAGLKAIKAAHLFEPSSVSISLRANGYLRNHTYDFIQMLAPKLTPDVVRDAVQRA